MNGMNEKGGICEKLESENAVAEYCMYTNGFSLSVCHSSPCLPHSPSPSLFVSLFSAEKEKVQQNNTTNNLFQNTFPGLRDEISVFSFFLFSSAKLSFLFNEFFFAAEA